MDTIQYKRATGLYYSRNEAESAVRELKDSGYDMERISVIAKNADTVAGEDTNKEIGNKADEGAATGALTGGALGGLTGLLLGPILLAGAEATAIATTLAGAGIGAAAGGLVGALIGLGVPEAKAQVYSDRVGRGSFLVMVSGTPAEIDRAANIMRHHGVEEFDIHDAPMPSSAGMRATTDTVTPVEPVEAATYTNFTTPVESEIATPIPNTPVDTPVTSDRTMPNTPVDAEKIKLYEERLVVDKEREKTGEVRVGKRVETETASVSVPVEKEYIVIEHTDPVNETAIDPSQVDFGGGEVARFDVYEESAEIEKQAFVREEVTIRKEVTHENVEARETIRHEELDIEPEGDVIQH
jgi:uncharacterized protein (TIGR02271 family)